MSCDDQASDKRLTKKIIGNWQITEVTYFRPDRADSVVRNVGQIAFTNNCTNNINTDICSRYAFYELPTHVQKYVMFWQAMDMGKENMINFFSAEIYGDDPLQIGLIGTSDIVELSKNKLVIQGSNAQVVFTR
ncbi:MAG: hypothetical protein MUE85_03325 [Microscillaceae bacterium]|jgi:hypothetical protein|nr:hypothetical protein [Microscillaceae bacterium]